MEFRNFLDEIDASVPSNLDVHMILDNSATHKTALVHRWLAKRPRYHLHFTPTGSSWLNLVERWVAALTEKQLRRGVHRNTRELEQAICKYIESTNAQPRPFVWTKTADDILASIARFCTRTSDSGHQYYNDGLPNMVSDPSYSATSEKSRYAHGSTAQV